MPPKVLQKNPDRGSGVLPIPASARAPPAPKPPAARLKLEIRRLPPGLTLSEFEETLGEEWKLGKGRVDWREYRQGKAKNVSKMPELSRCYVHLVKEDLVREFEARFLAVTFRDKAGTWKNGVGGAPMLGFAMNQRVPLQQGKQRVRADNRQGTIDQDAEYMAFLEAETQPIPKASAIDSASAEKKEEESGKVKVKSTPLIEDLRERKANKAKAAASKAEKADKKGKGDSKGEESTPAASGSGGKKGDKGKVEQAAKEVAKAANKQASGKQGHNSSAANANANANANATSQKAAQTPAKGRRGAAQQNAKATAAAAAQPQAQQQTTPAGPAAQRGPAQRQRGNAEGIKKMLQKDLGIKPKAAAADSPAQTGTAAATRNSANNNNQQTPAQPKTPAQTPKQQQQQQQSSNSGLPKAYLKHANPSQGMTEILIQQALAQFGEMNNVTIDPRKGTAIAVFKTQEGLKKAVQAKKVPVAKGAVEVIEFKDRGGGGAGSGGGGGGGNNSSNNSNSNGNNQNSNTNNSGGGGSGGGGGGGRGGFRNRGGRGGRGANNNSGAANANAGKGGGQAAAAPPAAG
jgi:regulator of nonsense transcripts 3